MSSILDAAKSRPMEGGASFPLSHRLLRACWALVWRALGAWTPTPLHGWRRMLLRLFGARLDATAKVYPGVRVWYPPNLTMGPYACLGSKSDCYCMAPITLEAYALVSQGAYLCAGTHDIDDPHFQLQAFPITLGPRCWVAADAFVGPGVTIGEGAVLGARSVTVKSLAPWSVNVGNPARWIRDRTKTGDSRATQ